MKSRTCRYCGKQLKNDAVFCPYCGKTVNEGGKIFLKSRYRIWLYIVGAVLLTEIVIAAVVIGVRAGQKADTAETAESSVELSSEQKAPTITPEPTEMPTATPKPTEMPAATPEPTVTSTVTPEPTQAPITEVEIGSSIVFGSYEQDNDLLNGKEDIEWLVLDREGDRALLVSRYALDCQPFNTSYEEVTWETCSLRKWLKGTFFRDAFSADEQKRIFTTTVMADANPRYGTSQGNDTDDTVFLLSTTQTEKYFTSEYSRQCMPTAYAYARGLDGYTSGDCDWWLRTPGWDTYFAAYVGAGIERGIINDYGHWVNQERVGVRPALWINLGYSSNGSSIPTNGAPLPTPMHFSGAEVGSYIVFGSYEQDNDTANGTEDIEWLVLAKDGDKALVISRYALDFQPYNMVHAHVTWDTCTLRVWLNGAFLNNAFSPDEQAMIQDSTVTADANPYYNTPPGNDVTNKIFLLSITEAETLFSSDDARKCEPTDYVIAQGAFTSAYFSAELPVTCWWWLRSPADSTDKAANVGIGGSINYYRENDINDYDAIRPALWIALR